MITHISGAGVALVTPFNSDFSVDYDALSRLIRHVTDGGVDFLVVFGTTGEPATMNEVEKAEVLSFIKKHNTSNLPIVLGMGGNNTAALVKTIQEFDFEGISAILSVTPYYNKPSQEGLYQHFKAVSQASPLPIVLYNVPGRTGVNMAADTTIRLARDFSNIIGVKEACGSMSQVAYLLRDRPDGFMVLSGEDNLAVTSIALGGDGVISVAANCYTDPFCQMVKFALAGDFFAAARLQLRLQEPIDALFKQGNPSGVKAVLDILGICKRNVRLPLTCVNDDFMLYIADMLKKYKLK